MVDNTEHFCLLLPYESHAEVKQTVTPPAVSVCKTAQVKNINYCVWDKNGK